MAAVTYDEAFFEEGRPVLPVRRPSGLQVCTCGKLVTEPVNHDRESRPVRPQFEGQWRTLLYI